jgi:hypothetical protein
MMARVLGLKLNSAYKLVGLKKLRIAHDLAAHRKMIESQIANPSICQPP